MTTRYFRCTPDVYVIVCLQLDAAYGYPNAETKTARALPLATELPTDHSGQVYLAIAAEYCDYVLPSEMLPQLLASGAVEELDAATYLQELPQIAVH